MLKDRSSRAGQVWPMLLECYWRRVMELFFFELINGFCSSSLMRVSRNRLRTFNPRWTGRAICHLKRNLAVWSNRGGLAPAGTTRTRNYQWRYGEEHRWEMVQPGITLWVPSESQNRQVCGFITLFGKMRLMMRGGSEYKLEAVFSGCDT